MFQTLVEAAEVSDPQAQALRQQIPGSDNEIEQLLSSPKSNIESCPKSNIESCPKLNIESCQCPKSEIESFPRPKSDLLPMPLCQTLPTPLCQTLKCSKCQQVICLKYKPVKCSKCEVPCSECQPVTGSQCSEPRGCCSSNEVAPFGGIDMNFIEVVPSGGTMQNLTEEEAAEVPSVLLGHTHQGDQVFSDFSRGRFCLPAALVAIHKFQNLENPFAVDIDVVLSDGDDLYETIVELQKAKRRTFNYSFLAFADLPSEIETKSGSKFSVDIEDHLSLLGDCLSKDPENLSLSGAVAKCFETHNAALVIVEDFAFCVFLNRIGGE